MLGLSRCFSFSVNRESQSEMRSPFASHGNLSASKNELRLFVHGHLCMVLYEIVDTKTTCKILGRTQLRIKRQRLYSKRSVQGVSCGEQSKTPVALSDTRISKTCASQRIQQSSNAGCRFVAASNVPTKPPLGEATHSPEDGIIRLTPI